jgi:hypothetical protein
MREKLKELLTLCSKGQCDKVGPEGCAECEYIYSDDACDDYLTSQVVDGLLAHNVIVLPVKPNDTVYTISRGKIKEWEVYYVGINALGYVAFNITDADMNTRCACEEDIGETVFLTEEDAINELKERKHRAGQTD